MNQVSALGLWLCPDLKEAEQLQLLKGCSSLLECFARASAYGISLSEAARNFLRNPHSIQMDEALLWLEEKNHHFLTFLDEGYPPLLKEIQNPPPFLSVIGSVEALSEPQLGVVGCRNMSHYGAENAFQFARALAEMGLGVTSGLARGVDALAHEGAIAGGGSTLAVLGSGLNQIYPAEHADLALKISEQGALISEFPLHAEPNHYRFPMRNRIISGLSLGVLVVEAAKKSGSLITAQYALRQNREVFAIPGSIHSVTSKGCHQLLKQGASLVESISDLLQEVQMKLQAYLQDEKRKSSQANQLI